eukprot:CAMPEP_0179210248 /NCGR_PEP_ID=MMETSP0796-20121207/104861_1 /TAXON_ID=73915 /ORGANISM="Pyrodinium bahamense, Strain pbaha01" /LENGTH=147 /DNA_ID=CAMNT_0020915211 /DNA_START=76 /DNA_END=515 /DNA_ORIENTATION=-
MRPALLFGAALGCLTAAEALDAVALVQGPLAVRKAAAAADGAQPVATGGAWAPGPPAAAPVPAPAQRRARNAGRAATVAAGLCHSLAAQTGATLTEAWRRAGDEREGLRQAFFMMLVFGSLKGYALAVHPHRKAEEMLLTPPRGAAV